MSTHSTDLEIDPRFRAGLARLWQERQADHLETIGVVCAHLRHEGVDASEAANAAHRLAGTLGMFGLPAASESARLIEQALDTDPNGDRGALLVTANRIRNDIAGHAIAVD